MEVLNIIIIIIKSERLDEKTMRLVSYTVMTCSYFAFSKMDYSNITQPRQDLLQIFFLLKRSGFFSSTLFPQCVIYFDFKQHL